MNKIEYFNKEYTYIKNEEIREDLKQLVSKLPDYFFEVPASSSGKYHPAFAVGDKGLLKHTKVAVRIAFELLENPGLNNFTDREKDLIIVAILLHDGLKSGKQKEKYTRFDHPLIASVFVKENSTLPEKDKEFVEKMISSHMGIWTIDYNGNDILPKPKDKYQRFVHMCDYIASRKFLNVNFNNNDIDG